MRQPTSQSQWRDLGQELDEATGMGEILGIASVLVVVGYMIYRFKNRTNQEKDLDRSI